MRKNRTARFIFNGALLAVIGSFGRDSLSGVKQTGTYSGGASPGKYTGKRYGEWGKFRGFRNSGRGRNQPG